MTDFTIAGSKPRIIVSRDDHKRLSLLASEVSDRVPDVAEELQAEMDRAKVVEPAAVPDDVIQMGSTIEYRADGASQRKVTLVFPGEADIAEGKISILTPIGTALIGLSAGQSIRWVSRDGRRHELTVLAVHRPGGSAIVEAT